MKRYILRFWLGIGLSIPFRKRTKHAYTISFCRIPSQTTRDLHHARYSSSRPANKSSSEGPSSTDWNRNLRERWPLTRQLTRRSALGGLCSSSYSSELTQSVIPIGVLDSDDSAYPTPYACTRLHRHRVCYATDPSSGFDIDISGGRRTIACWRGIYWRHSLSRRARHGERPS